MAVIILLTVQPTVLLWKMQRLWKFERVCIKSGIMRCRALPVLNKRISIWWNCFVIGGISVSLSCKRINIWGFYYYDNPHVLDNVVHFTFSWVHTCDGFPDTVTEDFGDILHFFSFRLSLNRQIEQFGSMSGACYTRSSLVQFETRLRHLPAILRLSVYTQFWSRMP
jgi:hypothetical protein